MCCAFRAVSMPAMAKEPAPEGSAACELSALMLRSSHAWRAAYDGVRAGLERARLPRICLDAVDTPDARTALEKRLRDSGDERKAHGKSRFPVFLVGNGTVRELSTFASREPRIAIVERYAAGDSLMEPLPTLSADTAIVFARRDAARVGRVLRLLASQQSRAAVPVYMDATSASARKQASTFLHAAGARLVGAGERPLAVLHVRLTDQPRESVDRSYERAKARATSWRVPLIADERERWNQGASIVLMPDYELVGRIAANVGRLLTAGNPPPKQPTAVHGLLMWINLAEADRAGLTLPMVLLAQADRIRKGLAHTRKPKR